MDQKNLGNKPLFGSKGKLWRLENTRIKILAPAGAALFLIVPLAAQAGFFSEIFKLFTNTDLKDRRAEFIEETHAASFSAPILAAIPNPDREPGGDSPDLSFVQDSALVAAANPLGTIPDQTENDFVFLYTVKPGDSLSSIARSFDISVNTVIWANNLKSGSSVKIGDQLIILPITGVKHLVKKGETIESIAKKYKQDAAEITAFNGLAFGETLNSGREIIIPDGELDIGAPARTDSGGSRYAGLPNLKGFFLRPIQGGKKTQGIHGRNGVDLAASCGQPILASAAGKVLVVQDTGWNGGFGKYAVINHENGTQTVYAHNQENLVIAGENVAQGQIVGLIGNTGNTRGATGCHVHFEIHGARNPF